MHSDDVGAHSYWETDKRQYMAKHTQATKFGIAVLTALITLAALLAAAFCVVILGGSDTAFADDIKEYTVTIRQRDDDGNLYPYGDLYYVQAPDGREIVRGNSSEFVAAARRIIDAVDADKGNSDYNLKFVLQSVNISSVDNIFQNPFTTEFDSQIVFAAEYDSIFGIESEISWQYKTFQTDDSAYVTDAENAGATYRFGRNMQVNRYDVRFVVRNSFTMGGRDYTVTQASEAMQCEITVADDCDYVWPSFSVVYGTTPAGIVQRASELDIIGNWTLHSSQSALDVLDAGTHTIRVDYQPNNTNYAPVRSIEVSTTVYPYRVDVVVDDAFSVRGQALKEIFTYTVTTQSLVGDDTVEDLGISLTTNADKHNIGVYRIIGSAENKNYEVLFHSEKQPSGSFDTGGEYSVISDRISVEADTPYGFVIVNAESEAGFPFDTAVTVELVQAQLPSITDGIEEPRLVYALRVRVVDKEGNLYQPVNLTFSFSNVVGAVKVFYASGEGMLSADIVDGNARLDANTNDLTLLFVDEQRVYIDYNWATIMLACIASVLLIAVAVVLMLTRRESRK